MSEARISNDMVAVGTSSLPGGPVRRSPSCMGCVLCVTDDLDLDEALEEKTIMVVSN